VSWVCGSKRSDSPSPTGRGPLLAPDLLDGDAHEVVAIGEEARDDALVLGLDHAAVA